MDDKPKIDLQKHVIKRVSRKYLLKIVFYIVLLVVIIVYFTKFYDGSKKVEEKDPTEVKEINNVTIEE